MGVNINKMQSYARNDKERKDIKIIVPQKAYMHCRESKSKLKLRDSLRMNDKYEWYLFES